MKIAVASLGKDVSFEISDRAGRAPYYLIFEDSEFLEAIENPFARGGGGAGYAVAKMLADMKIDLVVAEKFGEKMISAMEERGLKYREVSGKVSESLKEVE